MLFKFIVACLMSLVLPANAAAFTVTAGSPSVVEGSSGTTAVEFTVACELLDAGLPTLTPAPGASPAATAGSDFEPEAVAPPALLPCALVPLNQTVTVNVIGDTLDEPNENFKLDVTLGGTTKSAQVAITDDDVPTVSIIGIARVVEGDSGSAALELPLSLSQTPVADATIAYATEDSSAVSGADYTPASGQLTIPAGQTTGAISVPIVGDTTSEQAEAFFVNLVSANAASLSPTGKQSAVVIFDNDEAGLPTVSLVRKSVSMEEGNAGTGNVLFDVTLSSTATQRTEVGWKTADWTAKAGDYDGASGKVVFQPGQRSKSISVDVKGDRRDEPDEAFTVELANPVAATLGAPKAAFGIIEDDDGPKVRIGKPRVRGKNLVTKVTCPGSTTGCKGKLKGRVGQRKLRAARFDLEKGDAAKLKLKLSRGIREALEDGGRRAKLVATATDPSGDTRKTRRRARLAQQ